MRKIYLLAVVFLASASFILSQTTQPIAAERMAYHNVGEFTDELSPYNPDLGVRRATVADVDGDGTQEILATDYSNGGRAHVMKVVQDSLLEIIWSSPAYEHNNGSSPRYIAHGDCDGDGNLEIIFCQAGYENIDGSSGRIAFFEWNGTDWGTEAAYSITPTMVEQAGGREGLRFNRERLLVEDLDGDGRTEIIPFGNDPRKDVLILGIDFDFPGFASVKIEGGKPDEQVNGGDWQVPNSYYNSITADIDGDGKLEIVNHIFNRYSFWSIDINGPDDYSYPIATDYADARSKGAINEFTETDDVSYMGVVAADVNGDGRDEIIGAQVTDGIYARHRMALNAFTENDTGVYVWNNDPSYVAEHYGIIVPNETVAALIDKDAVDLWPVYGGDLNQDGKDEIYTGGSFGVNVVAIQYNGSGSLLDPNSYDINVVDDGAGSNVWGFYEIRRGVIDYDTDSTFIGDSLISVDTSNVVFDPSAQDTLFDEIPFTSWIYADNVDLDNDGNLEIVIASQSVYDSITVDFYDYVFFDSTNYDLGWTFEIDRDASYKIFNKYRENIRVLEYNGGAVGFTEKLYGIISPDDYKLEQNYPNPFNPTTTINFSLPIDKKISLKIFDMVGQEVKSLINSADFKKGSHQVVWDGTNNFGGKVASGNYIARLTFGNFSKSIKMTMLK